MMKDIYDCNLLIVDDESALCTMITTILEAEGFRHVSTAASCQQARQSFSSENPDAVILDVMLPDGDGFSLLREFRSRSTIPVLFLSARDEDENRLLGLGLGADDYITKPFLPRELALRLTSILTRTYFPKIRQTPRPVFSLGEVMVDLNSGIVTSQNGQASLTAKEFALLEKLYENRGNIVTSDSLCRAVWGGELFSYENALMVHIRRLREKIEREPSKPQYLLTARGLGYRLAREDEI